VYVIEDDEAVRDTIRDLVTTHRYSAETYASALEFQRALGQNLSGCIVTDVRMPGMSGLDLLTKLSEQELRLPVIVLTGYADVNMAVNAMKLGAVDFLEKPFQPHELMTAIRSALRWEAWRSSADIQRVRKPIDLCGLTNREVEVLRLIGGALRNREIARTLGISERTVEFHKSNIVRKTGATSIADLHRMAAILQEPDIGVYRKRIP
jgi:two-component system, LuxR family, response regulator FixJ